MIQASTDISSLVNNAFDDIECIGSPDKHPHEGDKAAYYVGHCGQEGLICQGHLQWFIDCLPVLRGDIKAFGEIICECGGICKTVDEFGKVYPL